MPEQHADGQNILAFINESRPSRSLFWHYPHYHGSTWTPGAAIRKDDWKLIEFYDYNKVELYNLANDIGESQNLADSLPERTQELIKDLHNWQNELGALSATVNSKGKTE